MPADRHQLQCAEHRPGEIDRFRLAALLRQFGGAIAEQVREAAGRLPGGQADREVHQQKAATSHSRGESVDSDLAGIAGAAIGEPQRTRQAQHPT